MTAYKVTKHRGHSGRSVFEYRVYAIVTVHANRIIRTQLGKFRDEAPAIAFRDKLIAHDAAVTAK